MESFLPFLVVGISVGAIYALSGVGLVVLYRASGVVNFTYGALGGLAAMVCWQVIDLEYAEWMGWMAGIAAATLLSWGYGRFIAPSLTHPDRLVRAMATLGFALMVMRLAQWMGDVMLAHGGRVVKKLGDGVLGVFGTAAQGVGAATELQRSHQIHLQRWPAVARMEMHVGVATGED